MLANLIDSQPREYPWLVSLIRRTAQGSSVAPPKCSIQELQDWMIQDAIKLSDLLILVEQWVWRLLAADFPIERFTLHVGTLHPQLTGFYWLWNKSDGIVDELQVSQAGLDTDRYRRSPLAVTIEGGEFFRARTDDPEMLQRYPLMQDLAAEGITDYCIFPLGSGGAYYNAVSLSTRITDGFSDQNLSQVKYLLAVFGLHVERHIAWRVAENVTQTYLGKVAADRVLSGTILRGAGESIRAVIWMSDLRGFTRLVDELQSEEVLVILNEYFERVAGAVIDHGGEVLKFMGDGLLAVFPVENFDNAEAAAATAVQAARQAMQAIEEYRWDSAADAEDRKLDVSLKSGIGLHLGEVFFGNVGAPERLDFTVIGRAINEASRVESLTKELGCSVLITEPVAKLLKVPLKSMGEFSLRGISAAITLFAFED